METIQSYPLQWPAGWRRTPGRDRQPARFGRRLPGSGRGWGRLMELTVYEAISRVLDELGMMGFDRDAIAISTNVPTRLDGLPRSSASDPDDPGAVVYWRNGRSGTRCMAIDRYSRVADNLAAISATLAAMRQVERHGGAAILDRAFGGFKALPEPEQWWQVLGLTSPNVTSEQIQSAWRQKAKEHHPDRGGEGWQMARINEARDRGLEAVA